jgi:hypothetical protein
MSDKKPDDPVARAIETIRRWFTASWLADAARAEKMRGQVL